MSTAKSTASTQVNASVDLAGIHHRMKALTAMVRLPISRGQWSGVSGSVLGQGTGSSIDFQDQRPYLPGDDPRHINWQAYARTGAYTMKLYRQEVTPKVDILFDGSPSMFLTPAKAVRTWELLYLCVESGLRLGASVKVQVVNASTVREVPMERVLAYDWVLEGKMEASQPRALLMAQAILRAGSLRVWLSDLLVEESPGEVIAQLVRERGRGVVFAPSCPEESQPDWNGNIEFEECEYGRRDRRRVEPDVLKRYLKAYAMHFSLWRETCLRRQVAFARVPAEMEFLQSLRGEALSHGAVELLG